VSDWGDAKIEKGKEKRGERTSLKKEGEMQSSFLSLYSRGKRKKKKKSPLEKEGKPASSFSPDQCRWNRRGERKGERRGTEKIHGPGLSQARGEQRREKGRSG